MIVIDASAMVEALVGRDDDDDLLTVLRGEVSAPHLVDVEVLSVLRGLVLGGKLSAERAEVARVQHFDFGIDRYDLAPLADRIWSLRHQYCVHDASYLALAEALDAPLHTCDAKLDCGDHTAQVEVHPRSA